MERVKDLCHHFKDNLDQFAEYCQRVGNNAADKSTGLTKIDPKRKFTKVNVECDSEGNVIYPIVITPTLSILSLGVVDWERPAYHSEKNIFPIGFKSLRKGTSMTVAHKQDEYLCEIMDGGNKPLFKVTCSSDPHKPFI